MSDAVDHSEDLDCWCHLRPGVVAGQKLVERRRLGRQEEHDEWDTRERLLNCLEAAVKVILSEEEAKRPFLYRLLTHEDIRDTVRNLEKDDDEKSGNGLDILEKLSALISKYMEWEETRAILEDIVKRVLSEDNVDSGFLDNLMQLEAMETIIRNWKLAKESDDRENTRTHFQEMLKLIGNVR